MLHSAVQRAWGALRGDARRELGGAAPDTHARGWGRPVGRSVSPAWQLLQPGCVLLTRHRGLRGRYLRAAGLGWAALVLPDKTGAAGGRAGQRDAPGPAQVIARVPLGPEMAPNPPHPAAQVELSARRGKLRHGEESCRASSHPDVLARRPAPTRSPRARERTRVPWGPAPARARPVYGPASCLRGAGVLRCLPATCSSCRSHVSASWVQHGSACPGSGLLPARAPLRQPPALLPRQGGPPARAHGARSVPGANQPDPLCCCGRPPCSRGGLAPVCDPPGPHPTSQLVTGSKRRPVLAAPRPLG